MFFFEQTRIHWLAAAALTGTTFDIDVPFSYELPNSARSILIGRKLEEEHIAILEGAEELLTKYVRINDNYGF